MNKGGQICFSYLFFFLYRFDCPSPWSCCSMRPHTNSRPWRTVLLKSKLHLHEMWWFVSQWMWLMTKVLVALPAICSWVQVCGQVLLLFLLVSEEGCDLWLRHFLDVFSCLSLFPITCSQSLCKLSDGWSDQSLPIHYVNISVLIKLFRIQVIPAYILSFFFFFFFFFLFMNIIYRLQILYVRKLDRHQSMILSNNWKKYWETG